MLTRFRLTRMHLKTVKHNLRLERKKKLLRIQILAKVRNMFAGIAPITWKWNTCRINVHTNQTIVYRRHPEQTRPTPYACHLFDEFQLWVNHPTDSNVTCWFRWWNNWLVLKWQFTERGEKPNTAQNKFHVKMVKKNGHNWCEEKCKWILKFNWKRLPPMPISTKHPICLLNNALIVRGLEIFTLHWDCKWK